VPTFNEPITVKLDDPSATAISVSYGGASRERVRADGTQETFDPTTGVWSVAGGGVPAPSRTRKILTSVDGQTSVGAATWSAQSAGLWVPRAERPLPRRKASHITRCDTLTGVTGSLAQISLDATKPGLGALGSIKLQAAATTGSWTATIPLTGAPWGFGNGSTPDSYWRMWLAVDDSRDVARSSITSITVELGTAAGFANDIKVECGKPFAGDGQLTNPKNRGVMTPIVMPMIDKDDADMPTPFTTGQTIWNETGTGFAAGDWAAVTQVKVTLASKNPADGSAYVPPSVNIMGFERVPLPPYALLTVQNDWAMPDHDGVWGELQAAYGLSPLCLSQPGIWRGTQGSTEMTLTQYLTMVEKRGFDAGIYAVQNINLPRPGETGLPASVGGVAFGGNNFGGGSGTVAGVPWANYAQGAVEQDIAEMKAYFAEYNLWGSDQILGQERMLRDDELASGGAVLRKYASFSHLPAAGENVGYWPSDNPYRAATYMLDATIGGRDFVDGTTLTANCQARIRRAIKNKEWLRLLVHEIHPTYPTSTGTGIALSQMRALLDYATQTGRFDGGATTGKIVSQSEALRLSRYAA
jgi:hypothetical protein